MPDVTGTEKNGEPSTALPGPADGGRRPLPEALFRHGQAILVLICLLASLALCLKLPSYRVDEDLYDELAWNLASRGTLAHAAVDGSTAPSAARPPGYPVFMAAVYRVAGHHKTAVRVAQAFLAAGTMWLAMAIASRAAGSAACGLGTGLLLLATPFLILYPRVLITETLATFLLTLSVWLALPPPRWALAGVSTGLLALTRMQLGPVAPILALSAWWVSKRREAFRGVVVMGLACLAVLSTWWIRNLVVLGRPLLTNELYISHSYGRDIFVPEGYFAWTGTWMVNEQQIKDWRFHVRPDPALLPEEVRIPQVEPLLAAMASRGSGVEPVLLLTPKEDAEFARLAEGRRREMGVAGRIRLSALRAWHLWAGFPRSHAIMELKLPNAQSVRERGALREAVRGGFVLTYLLFYPVALAALAAALLAWRQRTLVPIVAVVLYNTAIHALWGAECRWLMYTWPLVAVLAAALPGLLARRCAKPPAPLTLL